MAKRSFPVLVATDGSPQARAAVAATVGFPWPDGSRVYGVVASQLPRMARWRPSARKALSRALLGEVRRAQRALRQRWADARVAVVNAPPVEAILAQARKRRARGIVLGSRNLGGLRRLVQGSVSRAVLRRAPCAVLIVKGHPREVQRVLVGLDGSVRSRRAVAFLSRLQPPPGGVVTLLAVVEPVRSTSISRLPASVRSVVGREFAALETRRRQAARREVEKAARRLTRVGWSVKAEVRGGVPMAEILRAASARRADVVVVGARGVGGVERLLLGSVAEGTLAHAPGSVLVVK
jgi:nucleotide-binding universal stress UspA family protein